MFYCNDCARPRGWPQNTILQSYGRCELCNRAGACNDMPSRLLTTTKHEASGSSYSPDPAPYVTTPDYGTSDTSSSSSSSDYSGGGGSSDGGGASGDY